MQLNNQIKKYRSDMNLSQEELAEKVSVLDISLDQLTEEDIEVMKKEINKDELQVFNRDRVMFIYLLVLFIITLFPFTVRFSFIGFIIVAVIYGATMYFAVKSEKRATKCDIQAYKEIVAYIEEQRSDEMDKTQEDNNLPYPRKLYGIASAIITFLVCLVILLSLLVLWQLLEYLIPIYHL